VFTRTAAKSNREGEKRKGSALARLTCPHASCTHRPSFVNAGALANHERQTHKSLQRVRVVKQTRKPRSLRFKADALCLLRMSMMLMCMVCGYFVPHDEPSRLCVNCKVVCTSRVNSACEVADELGISKGRLSTWKKMADNEMKYVSELGSKQKLHRGVLPSYPEEEDALYCAFTHLRKNCGFPIDGFWLRAEMSDLLISRYGPNHGFRMSNGWLSKFLVRYEITDQMRTEKKYQSAVERKHVVDQFHVDLRLLQTELAQVCPTWGAFPPANQWYYYYTILYYTILYILYYTILYYTVLYYHTTPYCTIL
jgi:hypothetical protein